MKSLLIKDTTKEEREQIVAESIGNINGACDVCAAGLADMYQDYIDGKCELKEINMSFRSGYVSGYEGPHKENCEFGL
jgi:hypothetical protein